MKFKEHTLSDDYIFPPGWERVAEKCAQEFVKQGRDFWTRGIAFAISASNLSATLASIKLQYFESSLFYLELAKKDFEYLLRMPPQVKQNPYGNQQPFDDCFSGCLADVKKHIAIITLERHKLMPSPTPTVAPQNNVKKRKHASTTDSKEDLALNSQSFLAVKPATAKTPSEKKQSIDFSEDIFDPFSQDPDSILESSLSDSSTTDDSFLTLISQDAPPLASSLSPLSQNRHLLNNSSKSTALTPPSSQGGINREQRK